MNPADQKPRLKGQASRGRRGSYVKYDDINTAAKADMSGMGTQMAGFMAPGMMMSPGTFVGAGGMAMAPGPAGMMVAAGAQPHMMAAPVQQGLAAEGSGSVPPELISSLAQEVARLTKAVEEKRAREATRGES